jgi:hypothetical protein
MKKIWRFLFLLLFLIPSVSWAADPNAHQFGSQGWLVYSDCTGITANGMGCWNGTTLCIGNGTSCSTVTGTSGCTTFSCLAGIPSTIAGYGLTGVVQPYDATILNAAAIGVSVAAYNANTVIYSGSWTNGHIGKYKSSDGTWIDAGALVTPGTGVATATAIAVNTAGGFMTFGTAVEKIAVATFDGGDSALSATKPTHQIVYLNTPFAATITGYQISCPSNIGGTTANLIFDVWDVSYSADTLPTVANSMCAAGTKPQLTYGAHSLVKAAWACSTATTVGAGDSLAITIGTYPTSATGSWCSITLYGTRL